MRLEELRKRSGMTQRELAAMMGVQQNTISQWETGTRNPSSTNIPRLADILGCTIDELYSRGHSADISPAEGYESA